MTTTFRELPKILQANAWTGEPATGVVADSAAWSLLGMRPQKLPGRMMRPGEPPSLKDFSDTRVGWGLVLPDRPDLPVAQRRGAGDAPEPIQELLLARSTYARVFRWVPGNATATVSLRDYAAGRDVAISGSTMGIGDGELPMYLLLYGGPDVLPWGLQYQLNAGRFVGRLDLTGEALTNYVNALLTGFPAGNYDSPVVWSVDHGGDDITSVMRDHIGAKLAAKLSADQEMPRARFVDGAATAATISRLRDALVTNAPALLVTTSHGMTGPLEDTQQMADTLGLPVDALHATLDPTTLLKAWQPAGVIWYAHACCSAGADGKTAFEGLVQPGSTADLVVHGVATVGPRVAPLPRALLGASKPARAFVGHVEPTFDWTLGSPFTGQPLTDSIVTALYGGLCLGNPVGMAMEPVYKHIGELASAYEQASKEYNRTFGTSAAAVTAALYTKLAWLDRQSMVTIGDPTVSVPLP